MFFLDAQEQYDVDDPFLWKLKIWAFGVPSLYWVFKSSEKKRCPQHSVLRHCDILIDQVGKPLDHLDGQLIRKPSNFYYIFLRFNRKSSLQWCCGGSAIGWGRCCWMRGSATKVQLIFVSFNNGSHFVTLDLVLSIGSTKGICNIKMQLYNWLWISVGLGQAPKDSPGSLRKLLKLHYQK